MDLKNSIIIYTDGACSGNPGPGGWGTIVSHSGQVRELGGASEQTTNNRMELMALIEGFRYLIKNSNGVSEKKTYVFTDSVYVIKGLTQWIFGWKKRGWLNAENEEVSNKDLWILIDDIFFKYKKDVSSEVDFKFVRGHADINGNERCDKIAVGFSKEDYVDLYEGDAANYLFDIYEIPKISDLPDHKNKSTSGPKTVWYISYVNGVFSRHKTWKECEALVKGRAAKFKKVSSDAEESEVKKSWGIS